MNLPRAPETYDAADQGRLRDAIAMGDKQNLKRGQDIELGDARIIISSPNGSLWVLTASNAGALTLVAA